MPDNKLKNFHFSMLEDFLPVGMAVFHRAKDGGPEKVLEGLFSSEHPLTKLRGEGLPSAKLIREKLDKINPGLGNPAFEVRVSTSNVTEDHDKLSSKSLVDILQRIDDRLTVLQSLLDDSLLLDS